MWFKDIYFQNSFCLFHRQVKRLTTVKLNEFGLSLQDIVGATTDGAAVMMKFGRDMDVIHQPCYNHALHLAVMDKIFEHSRQLEQNVTPDDTDDDNDMFSEDENSSENQYNDDADILEPREDIQLILNKVRAIILLFKRSPVKNSVFQDYVKQKHGKEISLLMDCRTRWNSTETMLARFIKLYDCIMLALTDLNAKEYLIDDSIPFLRDLSNCLRPVKMAVESLSSRDSNLLKCEGIIKFVFDELKNRNDALSQELFDAVKKRVYERRNKEIISVLKYLKTKDITQNSDLPYLSKRAVHTLICELCVKLLITPAVDDNNLANVGSIDDIENPEDEETIDKRLFNAINECNQIPTKNGSPDMKKIIKMELAHFEATGDLAIYLQKLLLSLETIQPTSTESERIFSNAANICTKKRSSLSDKSLNNICFLKSYFTKTN